MKTKLLKKIRRDWDYYFVVDNRRPPFKRRWYFFNKKTKDLTIHHNYEVIYWIAGLYLGFSSYKKYREKKVRIQNEKYYENFKNTDNSKTIIKNINGD